jgi:hypothetical protein
MDIVNRSIGVFTHVRDTTTPVRIGASVGSNGLSAKGKARIDEVRLYNRSLKNTEVLRHFAIGHCADMRRAIEKLTEFVVALNLKQGISNSLDSKLAAAEQTLSDLNENNDASAINSLVAFQNAVAAQSGKSITTEDASELSAIAQALIDRLIQ